MNALKIAQNVGTVRRIPSPSSVLPSHTGDSGADLLLESLVSFLPKRYTNGLGFLDVCN